MEPSLQRREDPVEGVALAYTQHRLDEWKSITTARVMSPDEFADHMHDNRLHVLSVAGDQRSLPKLRGEDVPSKRGEEIARKAVRATLERLQGNHGDKLVVATTGLAAGVAGLASQEARRLGITTLAVVADQDRSEALVQPDVLVPGGPEHGDSVHTAVMLSSEHMLIGGSGVERLQILACGIQKRPVHIVLGFQGASQTLNASDFPAGGIVIFQNPGLHHP
jgi:hypothetical protein